jgi:hypothetical protein
MVSPDRHDRGSPGLMALPARRYGLSVLHDRMM